MPGMASGSRTFVMICIFVAPIDWAASTRPLSTSRRLVSTIRAMKGATESVRGTMAAAVPIEEPTMSRVNGMIATSRMMNGTERRALITVPRTALKPGIGRKDLRSVTKSRMPRGMPARAPMPPEMATMMIVSRKESQII